MCRQAAGSVRAFWLHLAPVGGKINGFAFHLGQIAGSSGGFGPHLGQVAGPVRGFGFHLGCSGAALRLLCGCCGVRWGCCWAAVAAVGLLGAAVGSCGVTGAHWDCSGAVMVLLWAPLGLPLGLLGLLWGCRGMEGHFRVSKMDVLRKWCVSKIRFSAPGVLLGDLRGGGI